MSGGQRRAARQLSVQALGRGEAGGDPLLRLARAVRHVKGGLLAGLHEGAAPRGAAHAHTARHGAGGCARHAAPRRSVRQN
eukprot:4829174-Pleurochrysis_carterae.AAC.3